MFKTEIQVLLGCGRLGATPTLCPSLSPTWRDCVEETEPWHREQQHQAWLQGVAGEDNLLPTGRPASQHYGDKEEDSEEEEDGVRWRTTVSHLMMERSRRGTWKVTTRSRTSGWYRQTTQGGLRESSGQPDVPVNPHRTTSSPQYLKPPLQAPP